MNRLFVIVIIVILFPSTLPAAQVPPLEALENLRRGFANMQDFTADISQEKQLSVMKKKIISTGTVRFRKPDLFYMELKPPHASRMVLRDKTIDLYLPDGKSRQQIVLPADEGLKHWLSLISRPITALPQGIDFTADRLGDTQTLTITPQGKGQVRTFTLISGNDGRLRKLTIEERNGNRTAITFHKMRANLGLSEKDFRVE